MMKRMLKAIFIFLLIISMLLLLSGCGEKGNNEISNNSSESNVEQSKNNTEFSMGNWENNVYTNDFLGIKFKLPDGWLYSSKEEIAEIMSIGKELLNDDQKLVAELSELTSVSYMAANNPNTGDNLSIITEKPLMDISVNLYIEQLKKQFSNLDSIDYDIKGTSKEKVDGREYNTLSLETSISGIKINQKYYVCKLDKYIMVIICTSTSGEQNINEIVKNFE